MTTSILAYSLVLSMAAAPQSDPQPQALRAGNHAFTVALLRELRDTAPGNLTFSPLSLRVAFGMLQLGAAGATEAELARVLHLPESGRRTGADYREFLRVLDERSSRRSDDREQSDRRAYELHIANSLWTSSLAPLRDTYVSAVRDAFRASATPLDFAADPAGCCAKINQWIRDATAGQIEKLIPAAAINPQTRAVLTNALHLKAPWAERFHRHATRPQEFHGPDGAIERPFMRRSDSMPYIEDDTMQAVSLTFAGRQLAMTILLPRERDGLAALERQLTPAQLAATLEALQRSTRSVRLELPKFALGDNFDVTEPLRRMGLELSLSDRADFGRMSQVPLKIDRAIHAARVAIDEDGAEASAATAIMMLRTGAAQREYVDFVADHPFLFAIHELESRVILFFGRCVQP